MSEVINIYDGGLQKIGGHKVGVIIFNVTTGEGTPETLIGYCRPNYRDAIIKSLKRLFWNLPTPIVTDNPTSHTDLMDGQ